MQILLALAVRALLPTRTQWYGSFFIIDTFRIYDFRPCRNHSVLIAKKVSKNAMPANANPPEQKSSVPTLFNVHLGH